MLCEDLFFGGPNLVQSFQGRTKFETALEQFWNILDAEGFMCLLFVSYSAYFSMKDRQCCRKVRSRSLNGQLSFHTRSEVQERFHNWSRMVP